MNTSGQPHARPPSDFERRRDRSESHQPGVQPRYVSYERPPKNLEPRELGEVLEAWRDYRAVIARLDGALREPESLRS
jgi:hypothetical protein